MDHANHHGRRLRADRNRPFQPVCAAAGTTSSRLVRRPPAAPGRVPVGSRRGHGSTTLPSRARTPSSTSPVPASATGPGRGAGSTSCALAAGPDADPGGGDGPAGHPAAGRSSASPPPATTATPAPAVLRENAPAGSGVLARICVDWEAAAHEAPAGVRVVTPRTGVVLSRSRRRPGPAPAAAAPGRGRPAGQRPAVLALDHASRMWPRAFEFLLDSPLAGPVNVCAPESADVNSLIAAAGRALHRPALLRVPAPVLRLVMGKLANELLLASQRMEPAALAGAGFQWQHPSLGRGRGLGGGPRLARPAIPAAGGSPGSATCRPPAPAPGGAAVARRRPPRRPPAPAASRSR